MAFPSDPLIEFDTATCSPNLLVIAPLTGSQLSVAAFVLPPIGSFIFIIHFTFMFLHSYFYLLLFD